jgi:hypothetical protein
MARIRSVKPEFFLNEAVAALDFEWRLLFIGLWTQADRAGRLEDRPARLKASILPYDPVDIEVGLRRLTDAGLIIRYDSDGRAFIAIPTWEKHQQPHVRESESQIPAPPAARDEHGASRSRSGSRSGDSPAPPETADSRPAASLVRAGVDPRAEDDASPVVLTFPVVGDKARPEWRLRGRQVDEWRQLYPNVDVFGECRKALAWVRANPGRRKTSRGMPAFLVNWLGRTVDRQNGGGGATPVGVSRRTANLAAATAEFLAGGDS